jgi:aspartyl-tRNA(Asn)/glutamyl-tRNA(Gln) amidotransferase subunit A
VGLKPTYGRVSRYGLIALGSSLDTIGTFTRTVDDAALLYSVMAGHDERDATTSDRPVETGERVSVTTLNGVRIGVPRSLHVDGMDPELEKAYEDATHQLESLGASLVPIDLPDPQWAIAAYYIILPAEVSANLARYDGVRFASPHESPKGMSYHEATVRYRTDGFGPEVKRRLMLGTYVLSHGYHDQYYRKAQQVRTLIARSYADTFTRVDCIATPTSPTVPFLLGEKRTDPLAMYLSDVFTVSANIAGLPAMSIPGGFVQSLPVGLQLTAPLFGEAMLFRVGAAYEHATDWATQRPSFS